MRISATTLWMPKDGNTVEEYEDAANPIESVEIETDHFRCAVADGATETSFAGTWAKLLVNGYQVGLDLSALRATWQSEIDTKELPWYASEKAQSGAFSTLLGLTIANDNKWEAEAVGDSCLFQIRGQSILLAFPLTASDQFDSAPVLLPSSIGRAKEADFIQLTGEWTSGDVFVLMTDAMARWVLKRQEEHQDALKEIETLTGQEQLVEFALKERSAKDAQGRALLRNDDVTFMRVTVLD